MCDGAESLSGMTVNERLWTCGRLGEWDAAVIARDATEMRRLLVLVEVADPDWTVAAVLADPARYGF